MKKSDLLELKSFLDLKSDQFNRPDFIAADPISIPHSFYKKEDIEISALLAATIAWGNRKSIVTNARRMMNLMDDAPHDFILGHQKKDLKKFTGFVHRTFNADDFRFFITSLRHIYVQYGGLESVFCDGFQKGGSEAAIAHFKDIFFAIPHEARHLKHVSDPRKGSTCKRLNMYLRWMVRQDKKGVDFGIWTSISPSLLSIPLDVHTSNISRKLGLLKREQNDWKAVAELDGMLRKMDPIDPVKYDFALFGLGAIEKF